MQNTCPQCNTIYTISVEHIGRRIACKNCRTALLVAESGLVRDGDTNAASVGSAPDVPVRRRYREEEVLDLEPVSTPTPTPSRVSRMRVEGGSGPGQRLRSFFDLPTALFAIGMIVTIVSMFGPLLDSGRVLARQADLAEATSDYARKSEELKDTAQAKAREEFGKVKDKLGAEVSAAKYDAARSQRFDQRGIMFGFVCLGLGCLGWISDPGASPMRHRVAVWLLTSMMVLVFVSIAIQAIGATRTKLDG